MTITINENGKEDVDGSITIYPSSEKIIIEREIRDYSLQIERVVIDGIEQDPNIMSSLVNNRKEDIHPFNFGNSFSQVTDFDMIKKIVKIRKNLIVNNSFNITSLEKVTSKIDFPKLCRDMNEYRNQEFSRDITKYKVSYEDAVALIELYVLSFPYISESNIELVERCYRDSFYGSQVMITKHSIPWTRAETPREFIVEAFGSYRKDLLKLTQNKDFSLIAIASLFKNFVKIESFIDFFKIEKTFYIEPGYDGVLLFLKSIPQKYAHELLLSAYTQSCSIRKVVQEWKKFTSLYKFENIEKENFKTWDEYLMYFIILNAKKKNIQGNLPEFLNISKINTHVGQIILTPLLSTVEIVSTGVALQNCLKYNESFVKNLYSNKGYCWKMQMPNGELGAIEVLTDGFDFEIKQIEKSNNKSFDKETYEMISKSFINEVQNNKNQLVSEEELMKNFQKHMKFA